MDIRTVVECVPTHNYMRRDHAALAAFGEREDEIHLAA